MVCDTLKILIARQHQQAVADAQLRQERIDRANLNAMTTARVAKRRGFNMIGSVGHEEGKCGEPLQNLLTRFRSGEALQQLLQYQTCRQDRFAALDRLNQRGDLWSGRRPITSQRKGPDADVHKETQLRERSDLWS
jgi:hypothetical protein